MQPFVLLRLPWLFVECWIWTAIVYFAVGLAATVARVFVFWAVLFALGERSCGWHASATSSLDVQSACLCSHHSCPVQATCPRPAALCRAGVFITTLFLATAAGARSIPGTVAVEVRRGRRYRVQQKPPCHECMLWLLGMALMPCHAKYLARRLGS